MADEDPSVEQTPQTLEVEAECQPESGGLLQAEVEAEFSNDCSLEEPSLEASAAASPAVEASQVEPSQVGHSPLAAAVQAAQVEPSQWPGRAAMQVAHSQLAYQLVEAPKVEPFDGGDFEVSAEAMNFAFHPSPKAVQLDEDYHYPSPKAVYLDEDSQQEPSKVQQ